MVSQKRNAGLPELESSQNRKRSASMPCIPVHAVVAPPRNADSMTSPPSISGRKTSQRLTDRDSSDDDSLISLLEDFETLSNLIELEKQREATGAEIDAEEVLAAFHTKTVVGCDAVGFDLQVSSIPAGQHLNVLTSPCPCCGHDLVEPRFAIAQLDFRIAECESCRSARMLPMPKPQQIAAFYPSSYYGTTGAKFEPVAEALVRFVGARQAKSIAKGLPSGARVLDVGCGRGVLLKSLADQGCEAFGFEISETAAAGLDPRVDLRIANSLMDAEYPDHFFDQVVIWHVLEHVPNPLEVMQEIRRILKPGGRVAVSVPNYSSLQARLAGPAWFHLDSPRHLHHFSMHGLRQLLEASGFDIQSEHHFSLRQNPFGWLQSALNRTGWFPRNALYSILKNAECEGTRSLSRTTRFILRSCYLLGMPIAIAVSVLETIIRSGASVSVVATAR